MSYGEAYIRCPGSVVVECDRGEGPVLSIAETLCRFGIDHEVLVQEELASRRPSDRAPQPWDDEYHEWRKLYDEYLRVGHNDWLEWTAVEWGRKRESTRGYGLACHRALAASPLLDRPTRK
jgi:hypothetical protein